VKVSVAAMADPASRMAESDPTIAPDLMHVFPIKVVPPFA
jgi:hypothetical protein